MFSCFCKKLATQDGVEALEKECKEEGRDLSSFRRVCITCENVGYEPLLVDFLDFSQEDIDECAFWNARHKKSLDTFSSKFQEIMKVMKEIRELNEGVSTPQC